MDRTEKRLAYALALALAILTLAVYEPVRRFAFVNYDDNVYVFDNPRIAAGLNADNVAWSLSAFENGNWHPLTLLSHMLDVAVFGMKPGAHHLVNVALHVANVLLLFWLLAVATRKAWPSAFVAAVFAVHPLNVETVAWISERKSLLCTAFWLAALLAHVRYRRRKGEKSHALTLVFAGLAMASKPMAVTLPLTLVLFDVWPLGVEPPGRGGRLLRYLRELAPFLALSAACGVLAIFAQRGAQALQTVTTYSIPVRLANAVVSYAWYLKATVWPAGLAVFYPHPMTTIAGTEVAVSFAVLAAIGALVIVKRRAHPSLAFGWVWYVVTLLPVSGLIQVGSQAHADRYAYVPLVGIFVMIVWPVFLATERAGERRRRTVAVAGLAAIVAACVVTRAQLPYWRDSLSLCQRAVDVVPDNALAHNNLGIALVEKDKLNDAFEHFQKAVAIAPWDTDSRSNLGNALRALHRPAEAVASYEKALQQAPNDPTIHYNLATAFADLNRPDDAVRQLTEAVRLNAGYVKARSFLGVMLYKQGRVDEALAQFREVVRLNPQDARTADVVRRIEAQRAQ